MISKLANKVLDDGDDIHITDSFQQQATSDTDSLVGNAASFVGPLHTYPSFQSSASSTVSSNAGMEVPLIDKAQGLNELRHQPPHSTTKTKQFPYFARPATDHVTNTETSTSNSSTQEGDENDIPTSSQPAPSRLRLPFWSWRKRMTLRTSTSSFVTIPDRTLMEYYQEIEEEENDPNKNKETQQKKQQSLILASMGASLKSHRLDLGTGRTLLQRQKAQIYGRESAAQADWQLQHQNSMVRRNQMLQMADSCGWSQISGMTDVDAMSVASISSHPSRVMFTTTPSSLRRGSEDEGDAEHNNHQQDLWLSPSEEYQRHRSHAHRSRAQYPSRLAFPSMVLPQVQEEIFWEGDENEEEDQKTYRNSLTDQEALLEAQNILQQTLPSFVEPAPSPHRIPSYRLQTDFELFATSEDSNDWPTSPNSLVSIVEEEVTETRDRIYSDSDVVFWEQQTSPNETDFPSDENTERAPRRHSLDMGAEFRSSSWSSASFDTHFPLSPVNNQEASRSSFKIDPPPKDTKGKAVLTRPTVDDGDMPPPASSSKPSSPDRRKVASMVVSPSGIKPTLRRVQTDSEAATPVRRAMPQLQSTPDVAPSRTRPSPRMAASQRKTNNNIIERPVDAPKLATELTKGETNLSFSKEDKVHRRQSSLPDPLVAGASMKPATSTGDDNEERRNTLSEFDFTFVGSAGSQGQEVVLEENTTVPESLPSSDALGAAKMIAATATPTRGFVFPRANDNDYYWGSAPSNDDSEEESRDQDEGLFLVASSADSLDEILR